MRKVAIVGSNPDGLNEVPWDDPTWEIWTFNEAPQKKWFKRWDVCFQLHLPEIYASTTNYVTRVQNLGSHWEWLQQDHGGKVIYMQDIDQRVPNSRKYPLVEILKLIPNRLIYPGETKEYKYLRSTIAEALALALYEKVDQIALFGCNLTSNTEYAYQATNLTFWIGYANGIGAHLDMCCWRDEFDQRIYGFEGEVQIDRDYFVKRIQDLETEVNADSLSFARVQDRLTTALFENNFDTVKDLLVDLEAYGMRAGESEARQSEAKRYRDFDGDITRQEFEYQAAKAPQDGEAIKAQMYHTGGICEYVFNAWTQTGRIEARNQLKQFAHEKAQHAYRAGWCLGLNHENVLYMQEVDARITAAGGQRALSQVEKE